MLFLGSQETPPEHTSSSGVPAQGQTWTCLEGTTETVRGLEEPLLRRKAGRVGVLGPGEDLPAAFQESKAFL